MGTRTLRSARCILGLALLLGFGTGSTHAQAPTALDALFYSERLPGTGTRLSALGGAGLAGVSDYGALYSNPAGLGYFETSEVAGTFQALYVTDETAYTTAFPKEIGGTFSSTTNRADQIRTAYGIGNAALIYKFPTERGSLVLGVGTNATRSFERSLDFQNRNQLRIPADPQKPIRGSSVSDIFPPLNDEVSVERFPPGESPDDFFFGQRFVRSDSTSPGYLIDFDPNGDGSIERPLSFIAYEAFGIDFEPAIYDSTGDAAASFQPVVPAGAQFQQSGDGSESGALREWSLSGAVEADKDIMLGISANVVSGSNAFRNTVEEVDDNDEAVGFNELRLTRRQTSAFTGFNLRGGLSVRGSFFRMGLSIETPTWYSVTEETSTQVRTIFDNGDRFAYGDDSAENVGRTEFEYTINTPWRIGIGGAFYVADATVLVDAVFVDWTRLELSTSDGRGLFEEENRLIADHYRPVLNTRVGIEYALDPLTLRAGFAYQPSPVSLPDVSPEAGSFNLRGAGEVTERVRYYPSVGVGYRFGEHLHLNLSWMQERFDDRFLPYVASNASYVNESVVRNHIQMGLNYTF